MNPLAVAVGAFVAGAASQHLEGRTTMAIGTTGAVLLTGAGRDAAIAFAFVGGAKAGAEWYQARVKAAIGKKLNELLDA